MRIARVLTFLALATIAAAACSSGGGGGDDDDDDAQGGVDITVACSGTCGESGTLRVPVHEGACGASPLITITAPGVTLSSSSEPTASVEGLDAGTGYCIEVFLDADTSGGLSSGDAIATSGGQIVTPDPIEELTFTLDALQP